MADSKEKLFSDFSPVSTEQWMEKVTADLKGADFEKKLVWKTNEGFKVKPFYRMEDLEGLKTTDALPGEFPYLRGTKKDNNEWLVRQEIKVECPKEANAKALDILNKGVDSTHVSHSSSPFCSCPWYVTMATVPSSFKRVFAARCGARTLMRTPRSFIRTKKRSSVSRNALIASYVPGSSRSLSNVSQYALSFASSGLSP